MKVLAIVVLVLGLVVISHISWLTYFPSENSCPPNGRCIPQEGKIGEALPVYLPALLVLLWLFCLFKYKKQDYKRAAVFGLVVVFAPYLYGYLV